GVLLPGWAKHMPWNDCKEPYWEYEKSFKALTRALMGAQVDFDVSEEAMIEKHACVKMINGAVKLVMGRMAYDCVAVPPLVSMRGRVASLLAGFAAAGGRVLFAEKPVSVVDFKDDARFAGFPAFKNTPESVASALTCHGTTRVFGLGSFDILAMHRRNENADMLLLVNTRLDAAFDGSVRVASTGQVQLFDTLTCERREVPSEQKNNETHFTLHLSKGGSALLFIASKPEALPALDPRERVETHRLVGPFDVSLDSPNILLLDRPKFRVENGPEGEAQILRVDDAVRDHLGFERRSRVMYQPWFKKTFLADNPRRCRVALDYAFVVEHLPEGDLFLCLEQPDSHALAVNGTPLAQEDCGHFADSCVRKLRVPLSLLKPGENRITSVCDFTEEVDLESMYLMGGFGVRREENNSFMTPPVKRLALGDITAQGLPHYAGTVTYHMAAPEDGTLFCDGFKGIAVRVRQGGVKPKLLPFEPYETEVRAGVLAIELICTMGNAFGNERPGRQGNPIEPQGLFTAPRLAR
ncbi:MAG: hypothetical protein FWF96_06800, partial [Kiritimatiellaeota bacterium]|nr:hypothetical protein [Kiritimatiellota bacterium]